MIFSSKVRPLTLLGLCSASRRFFHPVKFLLWQTCSSPFFRSLYLANLLGKFCYWTVQMCGFRPLTPVSLCSVSRRLLSLIIFCDKLHIHTFFSICLIFLEDFATMHSKYVVCWIRQSRIQSQGKDNVFCDWWLRTSLLIGNWKWGLNLLTTLGAWMLWKHQNDCVFKGAALSVQLVLIWIWEQEYR